MLILAWPRTRASSANSDTVVLPLPVGTTRLVTARPSWFQPTSRLVALSCRSLPALKLTAPANCRALPVLPSLRRSNSTAPRPPVKAKLLPARLRLPAAFSRPICRLASWLVIARAPLTLPRPVKAMLAELMRSSCCWAAPRFTVTALEPLPMLRLMALPVVLMRNSPVALRLTPLKPCRPTLPLATRA